MRTAKGGQSGDNILRHNLTRKHMHELHNIVRHRTHMQGKNKANKNNNIKPTRRHICNINLYTNIRNI